MQASIDENEAQFARPWHLKMPEESLLKKLKAIVGFEIEITRLEGKFKLSQNRSAADQRRVIAALDEEMSPDTAELMRQRLDRK